jgi:beta-lactamase superfamily II metal-dependent hydrolase
MTERGKVETRHDRTVKTANAHYTGTQRSRAPANGTCHTTPEALSVHANNTSIQLPLPPYGESALMTGDLTLVLRRQPARRGDVDE